MAFDCKIFDRKVFFSEDQTEVFRAKDVVLSSAAVSVVFYPRLVSPIGMDAPELRKYLLVDGGGKDNNPTALIIEQARKIYPNAKQFEVVSLGNGVIGDPLWYSFFKKVVQVSKLVWRLFDKRLNVVPSDPDEYVSRLVVGNYTRINLEISSTNASPLDASAKNLKALQEDTLRHLAINGEQFKALVDRLKAE